MAKIGRNASSGRIVLKSGKGGKPTTIRNKKTGEIVVLHGYGSMKGKLELREGIDLTKPIVAQVLKLEARPKPKSSTKRARKKA